jgi:hypothetical protein
MNEGAVTTSVLVFPVTHSFYSVEVFPIPICECRSSFKIRLIGLDVSTI